MSQQVGRYSGTSISYLEIVFIINIKVGRIPTGRLLQPSFVQDPLHGKVDIKEKSCIDSDQDCTRITSLGSRCDCVKSVSRT